MKRNHLDYYYCWLVCFQLIITTVIDITITAIIAEVAMLLLF